MKTSDKKLLRFMGFKLQGDLGAFTCYTSQRNRVVWFIKAPPKEKPSPEQKYLHDKWREAVHAWQAMPPDRRAAWNRAARRTHLRISAYNLWIYYRMTGDSSVIKTIEHQSGEELLEI